jgi:tetratricopeptide (TPR) repeat protein
MKTIYQSLLLLLPLLMVCSPTVEAQEGRLKKAVRQLEKAGEAADYLKLAARFEQLKQSDPDNWLPAYYHAFCLIRYAYRTPKVEEVDRYCDQALEVLQAIDMEKADAAEILCLKGMERSVRIRVDLMLRGMEYSMASEQYLEEALSVDPDNPRAYLLKGHNAFNRPEIFGGGPDTAQPFYEKSVDLFEKENRQSPTPNWGRQSAANMLSTCNSSSE